jgi:formate C-acetyltransferase
MNAASRCQWILWHLLAAFMFNGSGSLGRLDVLLLPYYARERAAGTLSDDQAILHIADILLREAAYIQLGGPRADGTDATNPVSFLVLEAAHRLKIPANVGVCVGPSTDPRLFRRGVEILLEDRLGIPKFLGVDNTLAGFMKNGYPAQLARERAYSGCHWSALPGREYCLNDCIKINFARIWEIALAEDGAPCVEDLWARFERHLGRAVEAAIRGMEFHLEHSHECFPELVIDLLCHGPLERGRDASHWGVEFTNICMDGAALATVADSFAAVEQRVEREGRLTWEELRGHLAANWFGPEGEQARLMLRTVPRYGSGGSRADDWARRIAATFTRLVVETPTPGPFKMIPGLFSWAATIPMGREIGATPNGRRAGEPISHGANPDPGFRADGAPTALAVAVAAVQPAYGNTAPLQIELDPLTASAAQATHMVQDLLQAHFNLGGTQVNINVLDRARLLEAHDDPSKYPDLVVRVTGFSAYFASLSPEFRKLVVDRVVAAA